MKPVMVARPRPRGLCRICDLHPDDRQEVNAAIWDGTTRRRNYRAAAARAFTDLTAEGIDVKTVTRHADHTEESWRPATADDPAAGRERPVFATDFESMVEQAATAGSEAMAKLHQRIASGEIGDRELLGAAKLGLDARFRQKELEAAKARPEIGLLAIISIASGHADVPEAEVIEVVDPKTLKATVQAERLRLEARAARTED